MSGARLRRCSLLAALPCLLFSCCPHAKSLTETCCCRPPQHLLLAALRFTRLHGTSLGRSFQDSSPPCLAGAPCPSLPCTLHLASPPLAACASRCALSRPPLDIKAPRLSGVAGAAARARLWLSKRGCCLAGALQHRHLGALLARRRLCAHGQRRLHRQGVHACACARAGWPNQAVGSCCALESESGCGAWWRGRARLSTLAESNGSRSPLLPFVTRGAICRCGISRPGTLPSSRSSAAARPSSTSLSVFAASSLINIERDKGQRARCLACRPARQRRRQSPPLPVAITVSCSQTTSGRLGALPAASPTLPLPPPPWRTTCCQPYSSPSPFPLAHSLDASPTPPFSCTLVLFPSHARASLRCQRVL